MHCRTNGNDHEAIGRVGLAIAGESRKSIDPIARRVSPKFRVSNDWRIASYDWMAGDCEALSGATQNAFRLAFEKHAALG